MNESRRDQLRTESHEPLFFPPVDLGEPGVEAWGLAWEEQVSAALTWQACRPEEPVGTVRREGGERPMIVPPLEETGHSGRQGAEGERPTMRTIMRMNTLMVSLRERLLQIQTEAANVAIHEMALRQAPAGEGTATEDFPPLPVLHDPNAQRITELARSWFEVIAAAQASMAALTGQGQGGRQPFVERRKRSVLIDFPDRRRAA